jgi:tetratricopeptide (TPR) repeat protein
VYLQAAELHMKGDLQGAEIKYRAAIECGQSAAQALHNLGALLLELHGTKRVGWCALRWSPLHLQKPGAQAQPPWPGRATRPAAPAQAEEAIACIRSAVQLEPSSAKFRGTLGVALERCGRLQEAAEAYERAHEKDPGDPKVRPAPGEGGAEGAAGSLIRHHGGGSTAQQLARPARQHPVSSTPLAPGAGGAQPGARAQAQQPQRRGGRGVRQGDCAAAGPPQRALQARQSAAAPRPPAPGGGLPQVRGCSRLGDADRVAPRRCPIHLLRAMLSTGSLASP